MCVSACVWAGVCPCLYGCGSWGECVFLRAYVCVLYAVFAFKVSPVSKQGTSSTLLSTSHTHKHTRTQAGLHALAPSLDAPSFRDIWRAVAVPVNRFLFNYVATEAYFSPAGKSI